MKRLGNSLASIRAMRPELLRANSFHVKHKKWNKR